MLGAAPPHETLSYLPSEPPAVDASLSLWFCPSPTAVCFSPRMLSPALLCALVTLSVARSRPHLPAAAFPQMVELINEADTTWMVSRHRLCVCARTPL